MIWNFNDTHSTNGERRSYTYSVCGEAALCNYRVQSKSRLDSSTNAVMIIRPWVGKGADPIAADLKNLGRSLQTDTLEPWKETIRAKATEVLDDGWAHSEDDSIEGMQRELKGMLDNDRHERLIAQFEAQEHERAVKKRQAIEESIEKRGGPGFVEQPAFTVMTEADVQNRSLKLKLGRPGLRPGDMEDLLHSPDDRLAKYR